MKLSNMIAVVGLIVSGATATLAADLDLYEQSFVTTTHIGDLDGVGNLERRIKCRKKATSKKASVCRR